MWPTLLDWLLDDANGARVLKPILLKFKTAHAAAEVKREQEILATPIDDEAWEEELQRRASIDQPWTGLLKSTTVS
jgi:hypothetical protein